MTRVIYLLAIVLSFAVGWAIGHFPFSGQTGRTLPRDSVSAPSGQAEVGQPHEILGDYFDGDAPIHVFYYPWNPKEELALPEPVYTPKEVTLLPDERRHREFCTLAGRTPIRPTDVTRYSFLPGFADQGVKEPTQSISILYQERAGGFMKVFVYRSNWLLIRLPSGEYVHREVGWPLFEALALLGNGE